MMLRIDLGIAQGGERADGTGQSPLQLGLMNEGSPQGEQRQQAAGRYPVGMHLFHPLVLAQCQGRPPILPNEPVGLRNPALPHEPSRLVGMKTGSGGWQRLGALHSGDGGGSGPVLKPAQHHLYLLFGTGNQDFHRAIFQVVGMPPQPQLQRPLPGEVAKPHSLNLTPHPHDKRLLSHLSHLSLK